MTPGDPPSKSAIVSPKKSVDSPISFGSYSHLGSLKLTPFKFSSISLQLTSHRNQTLVKLIT